jgi:hypothetical protein
VDEEEEALLRALMGDALLDRSDLVFLGDELFVTHGRHLCQRPHRPARPCCIHNPSEWPLREAPLAWHAQRRTMYRKCSHGKLHPDLDDLLFKSQYANGFEPLTVLRISQHACDGCCWIYPSEHVRQKPTAPPSFPGLEA